MESFFDEESGDIDLGAFEIFMTKSRLEAGGFVPGAKVKARTIRVEEQKRRPSRIKVRMVLDSKEDIQDAVGEGAVSDEFWFDANGSSPSVLIYRTTDRNRRMLVGESGFQLNDHEGTREITKSETFRSMQTVTTSPCASPFTEEAILDESIPLCSMYSLLVECDGKTFSQELHLFLARGHEHAILHAVQLIDEFRKAGAVLEAKAYLYFTGFGSPAHGQVLFECNVPAVHGP